MGKNADQFGPDLVQATAVGFAFLVKNTRQFRRHLQMCLRVLLDLDIDHFLDQGYKINWLHDAKCSNPRASFSQGRGGFAASATPFCGRKHRTSNIEAPNIQ